MVLISVICMNCGREAAYDPPDANNPYGVWHWHQPCPYCGAENWRSHELDKDLKTGRPREEML